MLPLDNEYLDLMDENMCENMLFEHSYVKQIEAAKDSIFNDICKVAKAPTHQLIRAQYLDVRTITKAQLADWLETVVCILDTFTLPVLSCAGSVIRDLSAVKDEKIADQKTIINLQEKLIQKKEDNLKTVSTTVKNEMQSYSSAVKISCAHALAPKKIKTAMKKAVDEQDRSRNLIIYGMKEEDNEVLETKVTEVLEQLNEKPRIANCSRIGKDGTAKPVKITLSSSDLVYQILKKTKMLKDVEGFNSIYVCPDRAVDERLAYRKLAEELKLKRIQEPDKVHLIRRGTIVSTVKN